MSETTMFGFEGRTARVNCKSIRRFGQAEQRCTSLVLGVSVEGLKAAQIAILFAASEDAVLRALWNVEELDQGVPLHNVTKRLPALEYLDSEATFTDKHFFRLGDLKTERTHLVKDFRVLPQDGCTADVEFSVTIQSPSEHFMAGFADLLRDPVELELRHDPALPFADIRQPPAGGGKGDDGQGGLNV